MRSALDHGLQDVDLDLYMSLREGPDATVTVEGIRKAVEGMAGLDLDRDHRLANFRAELAALPRHTSVSPAEFERLVRAGGQQVLLALRGELAIPDFHDFQGAVQQIYSEITALDPIGQEPGPPRNPPRLAVFDKGYPAARNADYIPSLSTVADGWGVAICTVDGQTLSFGDAGLPFSIQSCCKPVNYCQALESFNRGAGETRGIEGGNEPPEMKSERKQRRDDARKIAEFDDLARSESNLGVHDFIDCEPSGEAFNAFSFNQFGMPANPMINAGAIMTGALVSRARALDIAMPEILEIWRRLAGMKSRPSYDTETAGGEQRTGSNNKAIAYKLESLEAFPFSVDSEEKLRRVLDFYFNSCSVAMTADQMSVVAATLANRGVCPLTGDRVFHAATVTNCLASMLHCGMYDASGKFGRVVGLPAKSGVGGGILLVVPGVMGICTWSPRLDKIGNSLRGLRFYERLLDRYALHMLELPSVLGNRKLDIKVSHLRSKTQAIQDVVSAASRGDVDAIKQLDHEAGGSAAYMGLLQAADYDGRTALHLAAAEGQEALVRFLLSKKVDPQPLDRWQQTPRADALRGGHLAIVELLDAAGATAELGAVALGWREAVPAALEQFAPARATTKRQLEAVWAAAEGDLVTLRRYVAKGLSLHTRDYDDRTPLHLATALGHVEVLAFLASHLVNHGDGRPLCDAERAARLSWPDRWGRTALDEAQDPRVLPGAGKDEDEIRADLPGCAEVLLPLGAMCGERLARLGQEEASLL